MVNIISLFAGGGGSSYGYKEAGGKIVCAIEFDNIACKNYKDNHLDTDIINEDVSLIKGSTLLNKYKKIDILDGSPPCQGFSSLNAKKASLEKNDLCFEMIRIAKEIDVPVIVIENVPQFAKSHQLKKVIKILKESNYFISIALIDASRYGALTKRIRTFLVANKNKKFIFPNGKENKKNAFEEIQKLQEPMRYGKVCPSIELRIPLIPPDATNKQVLNILKSKFNSISGFSNLVRIPTVGLAPTQVKTSPLLHPVLNRALTIEEMCLIQGFPLNYKVENYRQAVNRIGNSVCPVVTKNILIALKEQNIIKD